MGYTQLPKAEIERAIANHEMIAINTSPLIAGKIVSDPSAFAGSRWQLFREDF